MSFDPSPKIVLENQFGEQSINAILEGTDWSPAVAPAATKTVFANDTGGSAVPTAVPYATFSQHLPAKSGVTALSAEAAASAITIALSTSNTYTDAAVNSAVNTALGTVVTQLNTLITQANALLAALKAIV